MDLVVLDPFFSILKLPPTETIPSWALHGEVFSVTRTNEELSIVCPSSCLPNEELIDVENDWNCMKVDGVLDFGLTGILASLVNPLAENNISIFAISTFNTDYLFIKSHTLAKAKSVLEYAGHSFKNV
jgi:hypothetical protein